MSDLGSIAVKANVSGLAVTLAGAGTAFGWHGYIPWLLVFAVLAFLLGIGFWAVSKTLIRSWWEHPGTPDGAGGFEKDGRDPMPVVLRFSELLSLCAGIVFGVAFLISVAA